MTDLLSKVETFVLHLFKDKLSTIYVYHNFNHTKRVVENAEFLAEKKNLSPQDKNMLLLAAWFHDTGYTHSNEHHEKESKLIARSFLKDHNLSEDDLSIIEKAIGITKLGAQPTTDIEKILKDADCSHFAREDFKEISELLRQEFYLQGDSYSPKEWLDLNIDMLSTKHQFYTDYAVKNWSAIKQKNLINLIENKDKKKRKEEKEKLKAKYKAQYKNNNPERSIQTLFRVTLRNHIKLSDIADTKANILLSVNAIIISLALANIIPKLDNPSNQHLMIPTLILICFSVASIILSILSTRPNVSSGEFTKKQVEDRDVNILFFGNFHKMSFKDYLWGVKEIIKDKDYEALVKDLYLLGKVLERKYRLLRLTYTTFMVGIIISVISFFVAFNVF
ncbi:HD domain-containing protein [Psychroflexus gondwanensis]|uniref:Pycsar system effector family protein n=1 Tax=Psychroflexus gondwanensis TaxID=251 RepID=UPI0011BF3585|nr:Pycsar system effector family protein [Psychroflexus gondwanensis]TXE17981.1 HD domain-containing protein [Psychroflexus gondwanensis]